eukprot:SAG25_NODE_182_length_12512_cov_80.886732_11_plen_44_part_00
MRSTVGDLNYIAGDAHDLRITVDDSPAITGDVNHVRTCPNVLS